MPDVDDIIAPKRAEHVDVSVGKVDQFDDAINHGVPESKQRVYAS